MKYILVATDFSPAAENALNYAADMALAVHGKLVIFHVYQLPVVYTELPVSPEAALGGNFSVIQTGDIITLDLPNRTLHAEVSEEEFILRKKNYKSPPSITERGYVSLYINHVQQAHLGAAMDFLRGGSGSEVANDSH